MRNKASRATVVGIDPGKTNFAIAALDARGRVVFARMLNSTVRSMARADAGQRPLFRAVMRRILAFLMPKKLILEEFVARGFSTHLAEVLNIMIGGVMALCDEIGCEEHAVGASTWKNALNQVDSLKDLYAHGENLGVPPHMVDAVCLATFLRLGLSFNGLRSSELRANVARASRLMPAEQRMKKRVRRGRKVKGAKDEVPTQQGRGRGRKVHAGSVLAVARKGQRVLRGAGRGNNAPNREGRGEGARRVSRRRKRTHRARKG
jgi:hypothetical protein